MLALATSCRTCMKSDDNLVNLFQPVEIMDQPNVLADALMECTAAKVSIEDGLPQNICKECVENLSKAFRFRYLALNSEKEFKLILQNQVKSEVFDAELTNEQDDFDYDSFIYELKEEPENKLYECDYCSKQFQSQERFFRHLNSHNQITSSCTVCHKEFKTKSNLDNHIAAEHLKSTCTVCKLQFETKALLVDHMTVHNIEVKSEIETDKKYSCPDCGVSFAKPRSLGAHMKKHGRNKVENMEGDEKPYKCDICGKAFAMKNLCRRHMKIHCEEKIFQCDQCPKRYSRHDQLVDHKKTKHDGLKTNVCSFCDKAFSQLCGLKDHIRTHTGETPFLCSECGKGFSCNSNLRQHMMRHTGIKPYACNLCPKTFCTKGQMTSHMATHTGVHPYKCDQCGASFTKPNSLKKHKFIHLGVKAFECDVCDKRFSCKDHLKRHYRIHTGERPYRCRICERAFTQSTDLIKHTRVHLGENVYQCTVCDMRFRLASELKKHYPTHYINGDEPPVVPINKHQVAPVLVLKPPEGKPTPQSEKDERITITFNSNLLNENGLSGDIIIDVSPSKS